jgi:hypothetical protein
LPATTDDTSKNELFHAASPKGHRIAQVDITEVRMGSRKLLQSSYSQDFSNPPGVFLTKPSSTIKLPS